MVKHPWVLSPVPKKDTVFQGNHIFQVPVSQHFRKKGVVTPALSRVSVYDQLVEKKRTPFLEFIINDGYHEYSHLLIGVGASDTCS